MIEKLTIVDLGMFIANIEAARDSSELRARLKEVTSSSRIYAINFNLKAILSVSIG
jgi:hypothetical protein